VFRIADSTGFAPAPTREPKNLGFFRFDGNVVGGALIGAGMAFTGACPGTAFVQAAASIATGTTVLVGGVLGALLFRFLSPTIDRLKEQARKIPLTRSTASIGPWTMLAGWELMCAAVIGGAMMLDPSRGQATIGIVDPVTGGLLIGLAQAASMVLRKQSVGMSTAYGDCSCWIQELGGQKDTTATTKGYIARLFTPAVTFVGGAFLGARLLSHGWPDMSTAHVSATGTEQMLAFWGGVVMIFGARLAGGCTSGHGISGMSAFAPSSIVSVAAMFAAGTLTAYSLR